MSMKASYQVKLLATAVLGLSTVSPSHAEQADSVSSMFSNGKAALSFRYRFENVDQDGIAKAANASTLKTRLNYTSASYNNVTFFTEMDNVTVIGSERYRTPSNGKTDYAIVADPDGSDINQAYLRYKTDGFNATVGRQRINHAGQRFVGGVGWRQNEQTYDALSFNMPSKTGVSVSYNYLWKINRIFGPKDSAAQANNWDSNSHALLAKYSLAENHQLSAYAYILDFDEAAANSSSTYGIDYKGSFGRVTVAAAYATQSDNADNPTSYSADYISAEIAIKLKPVKISVGYELLGSDDGKAAFKTPLATLHKFQGWSDKFLNTPATGVEDTYVKIVGKAGKVSLLAIYHEFSADQGGADYGSEWNVAATYPLHKNVTAQLKYAAYSADSFASDTDKAWLTMNIKF